MSKVKDQYEAYPYPERNPQDEKKRLIVGSPSNPLEIDHFIFGGARDWSKPMRVLVAGGGTGDALIQIAQLTKQAGRPCEFIYVDLSTSSREIAEERAKIRGLTNIKFITGSLLDAPQLGEFDYIDCCGVLHHLPDPAAGFSALRQALAPGGGLGFMVYAPFGRSGVYPLQEAFGTLFGDLKPEARLKAAQKVMQKLPAGHPFKVNTTLKDHRNGDAGFYDLLLHTQDRSFSVPELFEILKDTGWSLSGFALPGLYDLRRFADTAPNLTPEQSMAIAEQLNGTIKTHVGYAVASDAPKSPASGKNRSLIPHIKGVQASQLARAVANGTPANYEILGHKSTLKLPRESAPLIGAIDGRRSLNDIATTTKFNPFAFDAVWAKVETQLAPWGLILYSSILR